MDTLINNLNALLASSGVDFNDTMHAARLHSSTPDSNSYLTIWYSAEYDEYYLLWVYVNNYDLVTVIDDEVEDTAETLEQSKEILKQYFYN
ncbi:hypothetical protein CkP1_0282 [Citrobacter phage CkP1]|nr:hypothetical protein CkP1_0282 [Citrobacter phage CkP1]